MRKVPCHDRLGAIRLYYAGQTLLDEGDMKNGILKLNEASRMAPELDEEDWPRWARLLYEDFDTGNHDVEMSTSSQVPLFPSLEQPVEENKGASPAWWLREEAVQEFKSSLETRHFAVVDHFEVIRTTHLYPNTLTPTPTLTLTPNRP